MFSVQPDLSLTGDHPANVIKSSVKECVLTSGFILFLLLLPDLCGLPFVFARSG